MKRVVIIILTALLVLSAFVSCNEDKIIDDEFSRTVTFDANGGQGTMEPQQMTTRTLTALALNKFTLTDHHFHGWNTKADGSGLSYGDGEQVSLTEDVTLYAMWEHDKAFITFDKNGGAGEMRTQIVLTNTPAELYANEYGREGYGFIGWNTKADGSGKSYRDKAEITVTTDTTLYAQWTDQTVTVTFYPNGGEGEDYSQDIFAGAPTALVAVQFTKEDYHFVNWDTTAEGEGHAYGDGAVVTITEDLELYAQWSHDTVKVTFDANGGTGEMKDQVVDTNTPTALNKEAFIKTDHHFTNWDTTAAGEGDAYGDGEKISISKDTTLYAQWAHDTAKITFDANGGEGTMEEQEIDTNTPTAIAENEFEFEGRTFTYWNTEKDGSGTYYADKAEITIEDDITLYAQWDKVTITFRPNGGKGDEYTQIVSKDTETELVETTFIKYGYEFGHWNTRKDDTGTPYAADAKVILENDLLLYAIWEKAPYETISDDIETFIGGLVYQTDPKAETTTLTKRPVIQGDDPVTIIVYKGTTLSAPYGIEVGEGQELVILGEGTLTATGRQYEAGIGGGAGINGGKVSILGCAVIATGGQNAPAIGGGDKSESDGFLAIGEGVALYGGADKDHATFISPPTNDYEGTRYTYMGTEETEFVSVTFLANGGTGEMVAQVRPAGYEDELSANEFEYENEFFFGWNTAADGSGTQYGDRESIGFEEDMTLYAQWTDTLPLTLEFINDGSISLMNVPEGLKYSVNGGKKQAVTGTSIAAEAGDAISLYATRTSGSASNSLRINCTADSYAYGSVMSLVDEAGYAEATELFSHAFVYMFSGNIHLKNHETKELILPATTLAENCYCGMFYGCTGLTEAPELPATTLADNCYYYMFGGCTGLTTAPELPATELTKGCYNMMFSGSGLISAPELPATTLADTCYYYMFGDCLDLTSAPELPATELAEDCYAYMFQGCTSLETAPELPATVMAKNCYSSMFGDCPKLETAPELPATELAQYCYSSMFSGCTALETAPELPATSLAESCYESMFSGCTALETAPELPATELADNCYCAMFYECTSLTGSPVLPARELKKGCYSEMFKDCPALVSVTSYATDFNAQSPLYGWLGGTSTSGSFYKDNSATWPAGTIPSGWNVIPLCFVTFDANDGEGTMPAQAIEVGVETELDANEFTHESLNFYMWNTEKDGTGTYYKNEAAVTLSENTTLYAQWTDAILLTAETTTLVGGNKYILDENLIVADRLVIDGNDTVTLIVPKDMMLVLSKGINVTEGQSLTIEGEGWTMAAGDAGAAGIGGSSGESCGTVTINGGKVDVQAGEGAKYGIGAGNGGSSDGTLILGEDMGLFNGETYQFIYGPVTEKSETYTGDRVSMMSTMKVSAITSSTEAITLTTGAYTINDAEVTIKNSIKADGIVYLIIPDGKKLTVEKGINVTGFSSLIIDKNGLSAEGTGILDLSETMSNAAAAIGGGYGTDGGLIFINGATVYATGGSEGAGIGGGLQGSGGAVTINGGTVVAAGGQSGNAVAIGAGNNGTSNGDLTLKGVAMIVSTDNVDWTAYDGTTRTKYMKTTEAVKITFKPNGATETEDVIQYAPSGYEVKLAKNTFTHETLFFAGWATSAEGDVVYTDQASVKFTEDTTLYAKWSDVIPLDDTYGGNEGKTLTGGLRYTIADNLTLPGRLAIDGTSDVTLILPKGKTLTLEEGLNVAEGQALVIEGEGILTATGSHNAAGIGGGYNKAGGTVTINGGTVNATGGFEAAGIGGGCNGSGGTVTINGGTVTATSGEFGPGIGKGTSGDSNGTLELDGVAMLVSDDNTTWVVYDGTTRTKYMKTTDTVAITFKPNGATETEDVLQYVPAGYDVKLEQNPFTHETLFFAGWALTAEGEAVYADQAPVNLTEDTTLYAKWIDVISLDNTYGGNEGKKLTGGLRYTISDNLTLSGRLAIDGTSDVTLILPEGKTLTLSKGLNVSWGQSLVIEGEGTLIATGDNGDNGGGAGIGGGFEESCGTVTINGGTVNAVGGLKAAGIGGGAYGACGTVTINGGTVTATGGYSAAGIGGGYGGDGGTVTISGGTVIATGGNNAVGIGAGKGSSVHGDLTIADGVLMMVSTNNEDWSEYDGSTRTRYMKVPIVLTSTTTAWSDGNLYTLGDEDMTIANRITVTGSVTLILPAGRTLTASKGITVSTGNSLTIGGTGTLTVTAPNAGDAGIGGGVLNAGGNVTINGGTVTAQGGDGAAGIGGGDSGSTGGKVTINGGTVTATGGASAAGIGGGSMGAGGTVTINGGSVTANGGEDAVGIGAGNGLSNHGTLTIADGVILKVSDDGSTWSEYDGSTRTQYMNALEPIVLTSSTTAWSDGNFYTLGDKDVEIGSRITVTGSVTLILPAGRTLTASKGITVSKNNSLTISGTGTLVANATGENYKAGIGGDSSNNDCGNVTITGGTVTATGGPQAAGIGGGGSGGHGGTVTISGGTVYATGGTCSAGIGGGGPSTAGGHGGTVTISGGTVYATGGSGSAGIGGGGFGSEGGNGGTVTISGGIVTATGKDGAAGIGGGKGDFKGGDGADVEISGGSVTASGGSNGPGIGGGYSEYERGDNKILKIGYGVLVYKTGESEDYAIGPRDNVSTRYQNMTVIKP